MTKRELEKLLKKNSWQIAHGAKHDAVVKNDTGTKIPIPIHKGDLITEPLTQSSKKQGLNNFCSLRGIYINKNTKRSVIDEICLSGCF